MDDRIRISDADRERITERLREHFAEGRLTSDELDERITAALSAKTYGDLRRLMADLPDAAPVPPGQWEPPPWVGRRGGMVWRGPRILPLALIVLIAALVIPGGGWLFFGFLKVIFVLWLAACLAGIVAAALFRRRVRRYWRSEYDGRWRHYQGHGHLR
jgi:uncharacterized protein DUF1707